MKSTPTLMQIFQTEDELRAAYCAIRSEIARQQKMVEEGESRGLRLRKLERIEERMRPFVGE